MIGSGNGNDERDPISPAVDSIRQALDGLRYGTITVVVHDGAVVQVDRTEKLRLPRRQA